MLTRASERKRVDRTFENQFFRVSGLNLLVAAIILGIRDIWRPPIGSCGGKAGRSTRTCSPLTSPLGWSHISLTGDCLWERAAIAVDGFRPLNTARSRLKLVA